MILKNSLPWLSALLCIVTISGEAPATVCQTASSRQCWVSYSGPNYSQVQVTPGLMCAVESPQIDNFWVMDCYFPDGNNGFKQVDACIRPANAGFAFGPANGVGAINNIQSFTLSSYGSPLGPRVPSRGYFEAWALGSDGWVYRTYGNKACATSPNSSNVPVPWQKITPTLDSSGHSLRPKMIATVVLGKDTTTTLYMMSEGTGVYVYDFVKQVWIAAPHSALAMFSDESKGDIELDSTQLLVDGVPLPWPQGPLLFRGQNDKGPFAGASKSPFWSFGQTQPVTHTTGHAWLVAEAPSATSQNIFHSFRQTNGVWSAWQAYPTGEFPGVSSSSFLPWSVVDASSFRPWTGSGPNIGDLFAIGASWRLSEFIP